VGKKLPTTPKGRIISALRMLFLRSRERAAVLKRDNSTCWTCKKKASKAKGREVKVEVHHIDPVIFDKLVEYIRFELLVPPDDMVTLCCECHKAEHRKGDK